MDKLLLSWSGGKDSALALHEIKQDSRYLVAGLLTTVTEGYNRISMHGVREELLDRQAQAIGLPLHKVYIPQQCPYEQYEAIMQQALPAFQRSGVTAVAFGDILLYDIKRYRQRNLARVGMKGVFPLWGRGDIYKRFIELGFRAVVATADAKVLDRGFVGSYFDQDFIDRLPYSVDPNGENGEFHTFVCDGPVFSHAIAVRMGETVERDSFYYCDIEPDDAG